jgi:CopG family nickel-responsive transcriptional regulator
VKNTLVRFSVAIGGDLLKRFDRYCDRHRYPNRSEAVRGLMRGALVEEVVADDSEEALGVLTLIYDHHAGGTARRLTDLQHAHLDRVVTTTHVHLDERRCLEVILLRGASGTIRKLADDLIGTKGIETGRLVLAAASAIPGKHDHNHNHDHDHDHNHDDDDTSDESHAHDHPRANDPSQSKKQPKK